MTLETYLYFSIAVKAYLYKSWAIRLFSLFKDSVNDNETYPGKLYREPFGFFVLNELGEKVRLEVTRNENEPLVTKNSPIKIGKTQLSCIKEDSIETTMGRLYLNLIVIQEPFNGQFPFVNKPFSPKYVESVIALSLQDQLDDEKQKKPGIYYVDDYLKYCAAVTFIRELSLLFTHSVTKEGLMPAPGRHEFKKKLLADYKARNADLSNPIENASFEQALADYDREYLKKNDPAYGKFMNSKPMNARVKTYMTQGGESNAFINEVKTTPIISSLDEGMVLKPEQFTAAANTIRYGSYSRGAETVNGGVTAKAIMNATDVWRIEMDNCNVSYGAYVLVNKSNAKSLVGMTLIEDKKQTKFTSLQMVENYLEKTIMVRSPQFCHAPGTSSCKVCAGDALAKYPNGQIIPLLDVSSGIMNDSLKKMHNTNLVTTKFDLLKIVS